MFRKLKSWEIVESCQSGEPRIWVIGPIWNPFRGCLNFLQTLQNPRPARHATIQIGTLKKLLQHPSTAKSDQHSSKDCMHTCAQGYITPDPRFLNYYWIEKNDQLKSQSGTLTTKRCLSRLDGPEIHIPANLGWYPISMKSMYIEDVCCDASNLQIDVESTVSMRFQAWSCLGPNHGPQQAKDAISLPWLAEVRLSQCQRQC